MQHAITEELYTTNYLSTVTAPPSSHAGYRSNFCMECGTDGHLFTAENAAIVCQCSRRVIYRWIEEGSLHFVELADRSILVCGRSLAAKMEEALPSTSSLPPTHDLFETRC